jgi:hypothetical protein
MRDEQDDVGLVWALREAMEARAAVPAELVEATKNAYTWRTIDAELAELTFDSSREPELASTRAESASIRALTFTSPRLTIEVEVTQNSLIGQVIPLRAGTLEAQTRDGATTSAHVDEIGSFSVEPIPPGPFRLRYRNEQGIEVVTGWITL